MTDTRNFEDILLCQERFHEPEKGMGLWWCKSAEDVYAYPFNTVCLAGLSDWKDVKDCKDWIVKYNFVFVASPDREFAKLVSTHIPWLPVYSPKQGVFGPYDSLAKFVEGCGEEQIEYKLMVGSTVEVSGGLLNLADVKRRNLRDVPRTLSGFNKLDRKLGGFREGELTVWTGPRGSGKSRILNQILLEAIDQGRKVCVYSGELSASRFKDWITIQAAGPDNLEEFQDPDTGEPDYVVFTEAEQLINEWWDKKFYVYDLGIASAHSEDSIMNEFEYAQRVLGCDVFLVDNVMTARLSGDKDRFVAQSMFVRRLSEFCKSTSTHVHLVAHPRKTERGKGVEDNDDVSGSADITNLADNVISMMRLKERGTDGRETEMKIMKSRETGIIGKIGLCFDDSSRRFYPVEGNPDKKYGWEHMKKQEFTEYNGNDVMPF